MTEAEKQWVKHALDKAGIFDPILRERIGKLMEKDLARIDLNSRELGEAIKNGD